MQENVTTLNLNIPEDISADLKEFLEQQASVSIGGLSTAHNANNDFITYDD